MSCVTLHGRSKKPHTLWKQDPALPENCALKGCEECFRAVPSSIPFCLIHFVSSHLARLVLSTVPIMEVNIDNLIGVGNRDPSQKLRHFASVWSPLSNFFFNSLFSVVCLCSRTLLNAPPAINYLKLTLSWSLNTSTFSKMLGDSFQWLSWLGYAIPSSCFWSWAHLP